MIEDFFPETGFGEGASDSRLAAIKTWVPRFGLPDSHLGAVYRVLVWGKRYGGGSLNCEMPHTSDSNIDIFKPFFEKIFQNDNREYLLMFLEGELPYMLYILYIIYIRYILYSCKSVIKTRLKKIGYKSKHNFTKEIKNYIIAHKSVIKSLDNRERKKSKYKMTEKSHALK